AIRGTTARSARTFATSARDFRRTSFGWPVRNHHRLRRQLHDDARAGRGPLDPQLRVVAVERAEPLAQVGEAGAFAQPAREADAVVRDVQREHAAGRAGADLDPAALDPLADPVLERVLDQRLE